ncbi:MFS transporter [Cellulomonas fimi]|uniref:MFS transporter n=1 Tax=Cellulomonas fimi TaxID=1708 RepID=UPI00234C85D3|nr:MFS transporter [Cellulomonas fimi]MDC7122597.1 MFS transporter [Cellulomonas fimi]
MTALAHPTFRRLFTAQVVSLAGTGLATVALGLLAYDVAGDRAGQVLGTVFAIKMVAYVVVAPLAAALVVRLPRRAVLVTADVVRAAAALCLPFVDATWQVYVLVLVLQAASATHTPTWQAVVPDVLPDEREYTQALSLARLADDLEMVLSPVLAAALLLLIPSHALFVGTAAGFAASAVLVATVAIGRPRASAAGDDPAFAELPLGARVRYGAALLVRTPALRPVLALNLAVAAAGAFVLVQTVVVARSTFGQGDTAVALLLAANGAGSMAAALLLPRMLGRLSDRAVMLGGAVALAAATALVPLALRVPSVAGLVLVGVLWLVVGAGWACAEVPVGRLVVRDLPEADRPAAFAAQFSLSHACWLVTYPVAGWLGGAGLTGAAVALAVVSAVATAAAASLWPVGSSGHGGPLRSTPAAGTREDATTAA